MNTIGRNALITVGGSADVPAKVDTGADLSSIWASDIREEGDTLHFKLFAPISPFYTGQDMTVASGTYRQARIASSSGLRQIRYAVQLPMEIEGQTVEACFTLADRQTMTYPILLGCDFLAGKFVVDVTQHIPAATEKTLKEQKVTRRTKAKE